MFFSRRDSDLEADLKDTLGGFPEGFPLLQLLASVLPLIILENGPIHARAFPQLHDCPHNCAPHVDSGEILSGIKDCGIFRE